ncbi:MAG: PAS domain-containing sensor histidine kinase [bacterium]
MKINSEVANKFVLNEKSDIFNQIVENIPAVLLLFYDNYKELIYASESYEKVFGRSRQNLYEHPESWINNIHPEDRDHVVKIDQDGHSKGYEIEYRILRPDGSTKWVHDHVSKNFDKSGKLHSTFRFIEDIDHHKQVYESMRDAFQRSVEIVHSIPSGLFIYQYLPEDKLILIDGNPAAERLTGLKIEEWCNAELNDMMPYARKLGITEKCIKVIKTGKPIEIDDLYYKDERFEGNFRMRIFRMPGEQLGIAFEDITELKKSNEREAQAYAQGRIEIVDTLLHNIGNAINSVTTGIGTIQENLHNRRLSKHIVSLANAVKSNIDDFANYIKNDPQGQKVADFIIALAEDFVKQEENLTKIVNRVHERAQHIADIIRTERTLSKRNVYRKEINLRNAIDDAINVLLDSIKKRYIEITIDCESAPKEINIQESQFHQMLINLVKNSIEAIDELSKKVDNPDYVPSIIIKSYIKNENFVIEVIDNGIGIDEVNIDMIFRPGYTTKKTGSGLGLHSVANFVDGCGGQIYAKSEGLYKGTTMQIVLPVSSIS